LSQARAQTRRTPARSFWPFFRGTPRFLIVKDDKVIANELGGSQWPKILVELKKQLH